MKSIIHFFIAMLLTIPALAQQTVEIVDVQDAEPGEIEVVIKLHNFTGVGAVSLFAEYDGRLLSYINHASTFAPLTFNPNYPSNADKDIFTISFFSTYGVDINGEFISIIFDYTGNFDTEVTFIEAMLEITDVPGTPFEFDYINGSITAFNDEYHGKASLGNALGNPGASVSVPLSIEDFKDASNNDMVYALDLKVGFDPAQLTFTGVENNVLSLLVSDDAGVVELTYANQGTPLAFDGQPAIDLIFTYNGGDAAVDFLPGSIFLDSNSNVLVAEFTGGEVTPDPNYVGSLSIAKVISQGALTDPIQGLIPDQVEVPVVAADFDPQQSIGAITLKIAYDDDKLDFTGFTSVISGWTVEQSPGALTFNWASASGIAIDDGNLITLEFDYLYELDTGSRNEDPSRANIIFLPGTQLLDTGALPLAIELIDGWVEFQHLFNLTVLLEGLYDANNPGVMRKAQDHDGTAPFDKFTGTVADQITVRLHHKDDYSNVLWYMAEIDLNTDGTASFTVPAAFSDEYYLSIVHRNHLETVSAIYIPFNQAILEYDFTDAASKAFGDNQKDMGNGFFAIFAGDVNQDGLITSADVFDVFNQRGKVFGYIVWDIDGDGQVTSNDVFLVLDNRGEVKKTP